MEVSCACAVALATVLTAAAAQAPGTDEDAVPDAAYAAADVPEDAVAVPGECYTGGSVAGAVVGTFLATLALVTAAVLLYKFYWRGRRGKHLILTKDPEAGDQYAFDNPCFRDGSPLARPLEKEPIKIEQKTKWAGWPSLTALAGNKTGDKRRALDDSCLSSGETPAQPRLVTLRSRDFTGLGFNVCGNMRDGIFVRDVQHRGPAFESGCIQPGDRIEAVRISFRHMVFEDALTILSYASPYEVQLELESAAPAAPVTSAGAGSLLRPRRGNAASSSLAATERIVHPFFRSQSSADLAQISKASLRRTQQMAAVTGGKIHQSQGNEDTSANEYPTLKLASSPSHPKKENARLEKTAPTAVVKPERVKRASNPKEPDLSPSGDSTNTLSKFQKFGVRVLPDPAPRHSTEAKPATVEAEKHQNEQNLIKERVGGSPVADVLGQDTVDTENVDSVPLHYDERGIDVGPINIQPTPNPREHQSSEKQHNRSASTDDEDGHKENNVKQLLTKGLQNLKEKLHHDKRSTSSPECPVRSKDKKQKPARQHKTSMSSDSEGLDGERSIEGTMISKIKQEPEKIERRRQRNPEKDGQNENMTHPPGSGIPSEIPEEVRRAAVAARSNRKSLQATIPAIAPQEIGDVSELPQNPSPHVRETASESSSDEGGLDANGDSTGQPPKRSNKRKAPPPPAEDQEQNYPNNTITVNNAEVNPSTPSDQPVSEEHNGPESSGPQISQSKINIDSLQTKLTGNGQVISSTANITQQNINSESSGKDITNITIDDSNVLNSLTSKRTMDSDSAGQSFPVDSSSSGTSTMETKTGDYEEGLHVNTVNSDSDSDLERLEGDEESYDRKRGKKCGTTIELNSSHITIHHSPSSETMQMGTAELDSESSRKAASLGDLSRLDSEQPMSILERAVSLDLGDGGTPHSSKKRKAPLPPPGEEYLNSVQDTEDGAHYRKEPRLDNAMDTFQRRRLKKSSDWGTLEEALRQTDSPSTSVKASNVEVARMEVQVTKQNSVPELNDGTQNEIANLADDQKVKLSGLAQKFLGTVRAEAIDVSGIEPLDELKTSNPVEKSDATELSGRSSPECDHSAAVELNNPQGENLQQKKTVLHISQSPTKKVSEPSHLIESITDSVPSQVTIASSSMLGIGESVNEPTNHEVILTNTSGSHHPPISPRQRSGNMISSTPLPNRDRTSPSQLSPVSNSSATENYTREALQSPLVTSSDVGISNIHVVSSTTQDTMVPSELEASHLVSSATDHFVTAASIVDSTSTAEEISDNEDTWGTDQQPPELPTSPVPVLTQTSSSFPGSPSMTYITEIQVVTTTNGDNNHAVGNSSLDLTRNGTAISSSFIQHGVRNNKSESSMSSDTLGSGGVTIEDIDVDGFQPTNNTSLSQQPRNSITVTSIRTSSDTSGGQSGGTVTETTNHVGEKKPKPARPPVPPRKSDLSSPSSSPPSMSSSTIMVEVPKIRLTETASSSLLAGGTVSQVSPATTGKFISFSSLSPRAEGSSTRHGSSFEQWVFLDDSTSTGHHNGFETSIPDCENGQHSNVLTLPGLTSNRAQTVTHIILDTKQNSGGQVQE